MSQNTEKHTPLLQVIDLHTSFKTLTFILPSRPIREKSRQLTVLPTHWKRVRASVS